MKKIKITKNNLDELLTAFFFLLPAVILWSWWFLKPILQSFTLSFYKFNYVNTAGNRFIGLENYAAMFKDRYFLLAFRNSLIMVGLGVPVQTFFAFLLGLLINNQFRGRGIFRTIFYMPYVLSSIATATVFMYLFVRGKFLPVMFSKIFGMDNVSWFADTRYALTIIIIMYVWQQIGFYMIIYLAGLQDIPSEIREASRIDGATPLQELWRIIIPMLKPITYLVITHGIINTFQVFDQIRAVARNGTLGSPAGATSTLVSYFYMHSFKYGETGFGSAVAVFLFVIIFTATIIQRVLSKASSKDVEL